MTTLQTAKRGQCNVMVKNLGFDPQTWALNPGVLLISCGTLGLTFLLCRLRVYLLHIVERIK